MKLLLDNTDVITDIESIYDEVVRQLREAEVPPPPDKEPMFGGPAPHEIMKKYLVMLYIHHDWGLYDREMMAMCDTYQEALDYIEEHPKPKVGLYCRWYIYKNEGGIK